MNENNKGDIINKELTIENGVLMENIQKKDKYIESLEKEKEKLKEDNKRLQENLDSIIYSRSYKFIKKINKIIKRR